MMPKKPRGSLKGRHQLHGLHELRRRLRQRGLAVIDQRSSLFKGVMAWRAALEDEMGPQLTATRRTILDGATVRAVLLDHATRYVIRKLEQEGELGILNGRRRAFYPVIGQLMALSDSQDRAMERLGLEHRQAAMGEDEHQIIKAVRADLRRARRPKKPRNGIPSNPQEPTSTTEPIQESAAALIAQEPPTTPT